jgi:hypothetical protein
MSTVLYAKLVCVLNLAFGGIGSGRDCPQTLSGGKNPYVVISDENASANFGTSLHRRRKGFTSFDVAGSDAKPTRFNFTLCQPAKSWACPF